MSDDATRQHYKLATGKGLNSAPSGSGSKFAKGGSVKGGGHGHKSMSQHHPAHSGHKHSK